MKIRFIKRFWAVIGSGLVALLLSGLYGGQSAVFAQYGGGSSGGGPGPAAPVSPTTEAEGEEEAAEEVEALSDEDFTVVTEKVTVSSTGKVEVNTAISNEGEGLELKLVEDTELTNADGEAYTGTIGVPTVVSKSSLPAPLTSTQGSYVVAITVETSEFVYLSKAAAIEVSVGVEMAGETVELYWYDTEDEDYELIGEGTVDEDGSVQFLVDHFSTFVVVLPEEGVEGEGEAGGSAFDDVAGHWSETYVTDLYEQGVVSGKSAGVFAPDDALTRAELTKIALNAFGVTVDYSSTPSFSDVGASDWFYAYVATAEKVGVVEGYGDGTFKPNSTVNRAEALKILFEAAGVAVSEAAAASFTDVDQGAWYAKYVNYAYANGVVSGYGDGTFGPGNNVLRGEVSKMTVLTQGL